MRRASVVGPLLLIAIGALFLARNILPDLPMLDYLARYWPFILVAWGGLRLIEILIWAVSSKPLPASGVSGGEWTLVVFLCLFGLSLHAARGLSSWLPRAGIEWGGLEVFGQSYEYPFSGEAATGAAPRVVIESFRGSARIIAADENVVKVTGRTTIRAIDQTMADRAHADTNVEVTGDNTQVIIRPHQSDLSRASRRINADMDITVPRGATVIARGRDGDFDVTGVNGAIEITASNSSVRLENLGGEIRLDIAESDLIRGVNLRGNVSLKGRGSDIDLERVAGTLTVNGTYTGLVQFRELGQPWHWVGPQTEITAQGLPGELRMTLGDIRASNVKGPVRIQSSTKDMELNGFTESLDLSVNRGNLILAPGTESPARMNVRVETGDVEVALVPNARFELNAQTNRGEAVNDYGDPLRGDFDNRGGRIRGGSGGASIDVSVNRGRVIVRRGSAGAVSSAPSAQTPRTAPQRDVLPAQAPATTVEQ